MESITEKLAVGPSTSTAFSVNMVDVKKIAINALMTGATAVVLYLSGNLTSVDLGIYTPVVLPLISGTLDFVYRYLKSNVKA